MQRRTVLGSGVVGLVVGIAWPTWAGGADEVELVREYLVEARAEAGLGALTLQSALMDMARQQTARMAALGSTTHLNGHGEDPRLRADRAGYVGQVLGEALAETFDGPMETMTFWLDHAATRAVLLDPAARDLGLAMRRGYDGRIWWDLVVGA